MASFNAKQSGLIQDLLESLCVRDEEARLAVELLNENERLLIKNLENLQGDERDDVFISYTYGPDPASGRVMNRFGPITGESPAGKAKDFIDDRGTGLLGPLEDAVNGRQAGRRQGTSVYNSLIVALPEPQVRQLSDDDGGRAEDSLPLLGGCYGPLERHAGRGLD